MKKSTSARVGDPLSVPRGGRCGACRASEVGPQGPRGSGGNGCSRWTTRLLGKQVGLTADCVSDVLRRNGLKPHLVRTYKVSRDPDFSAKAKDVVGLYLNPPEHAVVLSVDEKTSIQALRRMLKRISTTVQ